jgi:hypothetical protein
MDVQSIKTSKKLTVTCIKDIHQICVVYCVNNPGEMTLKLAQWSDLRQEVYPTSREAQPVFPFLAGKAISEMTLMRKVW